MFDLMRRFGSEAAIAEAFGQNPAKMKEIIDEDVAYYTGGASPLIDRDHASREYVAVLRRIIGGADPHAEHQKRMEDALNRAGLTKEAILKKLTSLPKGAP